MEIIPTPWPRRVQELTARILPPLLFLGVLLFVVRMWSNRMGPDTLPGEVDAVRVSVAAPAAGIILEINVRDLQTVQAGEILGRMLTGEPKTIVEFKSPLAGRAGLVTVNPGEAVVAGQNLVTVAAPRGDRIICFLRQPLSVKVTTNQVALVRARSLGQKQGNGRVLQVGSELLPIRRSLLPPTHDRNELGLPVMISLPDGLELLPGELVDVTFQSGMAPVPAATKVTPPEVPSGNATNANATNANATGAPKAPDLNATKAK